MDIAETYIGVGFLREFGWPFSLFFPIWLSEVFVNIGRCVFDERLIVIFL